MKTLLILVGDTNLRNMQNAATPFGPVQEMLDRADVRFCNCENCFLTLIGSCPTRRGGITPILLASNSLLQPASMPSDAQTSRSAGQQSMSPCPPWTVKAFSTLGRDKTEIQRGDLQSWSRVESHSASLLIRLSFSPLATLRTTLNQALPRSRRIRPTARIGARWKCLACLRKSRPGWTGRH